MWEASGHRGDGGDVVGLSLVVSTDGGVVETRGLGGRRNLEVPWSALRRTHYNLAFIAMRCS